jgi:hypothetical protein
VDNDFLTWVELILTAVLERRDAQPLVDLAMRAGVDLDVLQAVMNTTLDTVRDQLLGAAGIVGLGAPRAIDMDGQLFSDSDLAALKKLGIHAG